MITRTFTAATLIATLGVAASASAQTYEYEFFLFEALSDFGTPECYVIDINNNNIAIGTTTYQGGYRSFTWSEADGTQLLPYSGASEIDDQNRVLFGTALIDAMTGATIEDFSGLPGVIRGLNSSMIGVGHTPSGGPGCEPFDCPFDCADPFTWTESGGTQMTTFHPTLKAWIDINNSNLVVGQSVHTCDDEQAIVWQYGSSTWTDLSSLLPPVKGIGRNAQTIVVDVGESGHVLGKALFGTSPERCYIWTQTDGFTFLPTVPGGEFGYQAVNNVNSHGHVVGEGLDFTTMDWVAYVWDDERGIRKLNLLADTNGYELRDAYAINDHGWIVGHCAPAGAWGPPRGFILKPIENNRFADLNNDDIIDVADLFMLLSAFGTDGPGADLAAPMNIVDVADLFQLLANWG